MQLRDHFALLFAVLGETMKPDFRALIPLFMIAIVATVVPSRAFAQNPPAGAIFDLSTVQTTAMSPTTYTQFSTSFVADNSSEYVSFAMREVPAFFSFDDASVTASGSPSLNLLADPGFESDTAADLGSNFPVGWFRWIQPVDVSFIGVVAGTANEADCANSGPNSGSYFWCDGSVEGYDALYQLVSGLTVGNTYNISWDLTDNSGNAPTNPDIDMLVYAGDAIPVGSQPIGGTPGPTPEPGSFLMLGTGMLGLAGTVRARLARRQTATS
jgi:hypothetical protein